MAIAYRLGTIWDQQCVAHVILWRKRGLAERGLCLDLLEPHPNRSVGTSTWMREVHRIEKTIADSFKRLERWGDRVASNADYLPRRELARENALWAAHALARRIHGGRTVLGNALVRYEPFATAELLLCYARAVLTARCM